MKLFTAAGMRRADQAAADAGIMLLLLMASAATDVAAAALRHYPDARCLLVLAGRGNNGGDAYGAARHLLLAGRQVSVLELAEGQDALGSSEARAMRAAWLAYPEGRTGRLEPASLGGHLDRADLVIDGLFGSGMTRALGGELAEIVALVNESPVDVFSIDLPSGLGSDGGGVMGPHIRASRTLQLAGPKLASVFYPAREAFGRWEVAGIGIPAAVLEQHAAIMLLGRDTVRGWLPTREQDSHKYRVGTVLVVAGSRRYGGAAKLTSQAALRAGAGLVTLASTARGEGAWDELIVEGLEAWNDEAVARILGLAESRRQGLVLGPGLADEAGPFVAPLLERADVPTVLDAGALRGDEAWWEAVRRHGRCVLTPHTGEAAPLLGRSAEEIRAEPLAAARDLAEKAGAVVVMKGRTTVIAAPDGRIAVSTRGHPGMATGGSGDVLAGLLGAWLEQNRLFERACAAVFVHGLAGELAAEAYGDGLIASDLSQHFPKAWQAVKGA
ncbi:bifunctional ADP-dependent NAD(P)H-hydrate dehydratase/NAD(P)H-hydrate epimerase [soil metagenome]